MIRPGPASIEPGAISRGVVVHTYAVPTQELLSVTLVGPGSDLEATATADAEFAFTVHDGAVCLVAYDGDTGLRLDPYA